MPRVTHFEINADDPERAIKFYENVFGWTIKRWEGPMEYWLITTGKDEPGIDGAIKRRQKPLKGNDDIVAYVCTVSVDSIAAYIDKIVVHGGQIIMDKTIIPGIGWFAQCKDTEGNIFGLIHENPSVGQC